MTERLNVIFSAIPDCRVFADIGCDHGYMAKAMLDFGKCEKAVVSDVSKKCLEKAEKLLENYIKNGKAEAVVSDGFENVGYSDVALIAGMGGEEIIKIILNAARLPEILVLQPMKNCDKVRVETVKAGFSVKSDYVFKADGKFYDLLVFSRGCDSLSADEITFGRTNLTDKGEAFKERLAEEKRKFEKLLNDDKISFSDKEEFKIKIQRIDELCIL